MAGVLLNETNIGNHYEMVDLAEFAKRMSVCPNSVRNWIKSGKLKAGEHYFHIGHIYRFPWGETFLKQLMHTVAPEPSPPRPGLKSRTRNRKLLHYKA